MRPTTLSLVAVVALGTASPAGAQQTADAAAIDYCRALQRTYESLHPVQQGRRVSEATLPSGCTSDTRATIAALERKFADQKIDLPPHPAMALGDVNDGPTAAPR